MKMIQRFLLVILILGLIDCSTLSVNTKHEQSVSFSDLKTYDWMPTPQKLIDDPRVDWKLLESRVHTAVDKELSAKGFSRLTSGSPDFLVGYQATLDKKVVTTSLDYSSRYRYTRPPGWASFEYEEGTLILDIVESKTRKLIWQGTARDEVGFSRSPEEKQEQINEAVRLMLENFPPT